MKYLINILILIALVAIIVLKLKENKEIVQERVFKFDKEQPINVHTQTIGLTSDNEEYLITGNFMPTREAKINSEMQGKITSLNVDQGSVVKKGQVLIKLDDSLLKLQIQSLDVKIEGLEDDIRRFEILTEADAIQGIKLEKAQLGLKGAKAQRETILEQIKKTTIYAPFSGIITMKMTELGSFAAPGMPLLILTDINKLRFTINVPESDVSLFKLSKSYPIKVDAFPNMELTGKTIMIGTKGNKGNTFPIQFEVRNTSNLNIKSGMFGKLAMQESNGGESIVIPASAIVGSNVHPQVYLITDGKAKLHDIIISKRIENKVIVESGLNKGDMIVTSGFINLFDGANISSSTEH